MEVIETDTENKNTIKNDKTPYSTGIRQESNTAETMVGW